MKLVKKILSMVTESMFSLRDERRTPYVETKV